MQSRRAGRAPLPCRLPRSSQLPAAERCGCWCAPYTGGCLAAHLQQRLRGRLQSPLLPPSPPPAPMAVARPPPTRPAHRRYPPWGSQGAAPLSPVQGAGVASQARRPSAVGGRSCPCSAPIPEALGVFSLSLSLSLEVLPATMFVLVEMTDTVRIPPWQFERKLNESIAEELNKKLANKVKRGSCIG